jgi:protein-disulfide isomerase
LIEYSDFECPFCGKFARETEPRLRKEYVETGRTLYAFRHLPLQRIHQYAVKAATAAACAGEQGKFWQLHDLLFQSPDKLDDGVILERAKAAALDAMAFDACTVGTGAARVKQDVAEATKYGITGTPTFLLGTIQPDGRVKVTQRMSGAQSMDRLRVAIEALLGTGTVAGQ